MRVNYFWVLIGGAIASLFVVFESTTAQIVRDTTLPVNSEITITGNDAIIRGGTQIGGNLFHSFNQFSVAINQSAFFDNALTIRNIISRVTGSLPSSINGIVRANGDANVFLINPNGISFGANAQLQIGGSFIASIAHGLQFEDQGFFNATNPNAPSPLLTINPSALVFSQAKAAPIERFSIADAGTDQAGSFSYLGLRVLDGRNLLFAGGDINIVGGGLVALGGHIGIGAIAGTGTIKLDFVGNDPQSRFPDNG